MSFSIAMALKGLALFLLIVFLASFRVLIARLMPECRLKRFLLIRVDDPNSRETGPGEVGSGRGNLLAELTRDFRALGK